MKYYIEKELEMKFEDAVEKVKAELKSNGFGVLTEINIHEKFKEKLDVDFRKYTILGACNPPLAYKALQQEDKIGTMLPCNVILQEKAKGTIDVAAVDPSASMQAVDNKEVDDISKEVKTMLADVIYHL
jgi:uncharacterized protein (DUF302 family)